MLRLWWCAFKVTSVLWRLAGGATATGLDEIRAGAVRFMVSDAVDILAALLAILAVRAVTRRMEAKAAGGRASVPGPWTTPQTT